MLDRESIIWEIRQALETLDDAQRIRILHCDCIVLDPKEQMGMALAFNHAIELANEKNRRRADN